MAKRLSIETRVLRIVLKGCSNPRTWTKDVAARLKDGTPAEINVDGVKMRCAGGWLYFARNKLDHYSYGAEDALQDACSELYGEDYVNVNDGKDGRRRVVRACKLALKTVE